MPEISRFYGIVIRMFLKEHGVPHFHAYFGDAAAQIEIDTGRPLGGTLPRRALGLVEEWTQLHRDELLANWHRAEERDNPEALIAIDPLP